MSSRRNWRSCIRRSAGSWRPRRNKWRKRKGRRLRNSSTRLEMQPRRIMQSCKGRRNSCRPAKRRWSNSRLKQRNWILRNKFWEKVVEKVLTLAQVAYAPITLSIAVKKAIILVHLHQVNQNLTSLITPTNLGDLHVFYTINYYNLTLFKGL